MKSLCVFCGSSAGDDPAFIEAARLLGKTLAESGIALVYGGANVGLMGTVADAALEQGGKVIGVLPRFLRRPARWLARSPVIVITLCRGRPHAVPMERP